MSKWQIRHRGRTEITRYARNGAAETTLWRIHTPKRRERQCDTASLQPPNVGGGIDLVRESQCRQEGHKRRRVRSTVTAPCKKKGGYEQWLDGAESRTVEV